MNSDIAGKKLLVLGATPETVPLIEVAKSLGVYTIVTDYIPKAYAKQFADKSFDVDGLDIEGLVNLAKQEQVDGVLVGVADTLIKSYSQVCEALSMPCYGNPTVVDTFTQKDKFIAACEKYGVYGIPSYDISPEPTEKELSRIKYPVLVKPVDNCSGTGMSICYDDEQLIEGIKKALENSRGKKYRVERYMTCDDMFLYYTFKDGEYWLSASADRYTTKEQGNASPVCIGAVYPSKHQDLYLKKYHKRMTNMFKGVGVENGVMLIQAFVENDELYVYDPGFRLQGEAPHLILNAVNGFDQREMLVNFALTGNMGNQFDLSRLNDYNLEGKAAGSVWFLLKEGIISNIEGLDEIKDDSNVIHVVQRFTVGGEITKSMVGSEKQVMARVYLVCDSKDEYRLKVKEIQNKIKVSDQNGNDMIVEGFDPYGTLT